MATARRRCARWRVRATPASTAASAHTPGHARWDIGACSEPGPEAAAMPPIDPLNSVPRTAPRVGVAGYDRRAGPSAWASLLCQGLSNPRPCLIPVLAPGVPRRVRPLLCPHRVLIGIVDAEDMPNRQGASAQRAADGPAGRCAVRRATASRRLGGSPTCRTPWTSTWPLGGPPPTSRTSCTRLGAASSTHRRSADGRGRTRHPRTRAPRSPRTDSGRRPG